MSNSHNSHNNKDHKSKDDVLSERSYVAAAHRDDRSEEDRQESLDKAKEIHLARTGSELKEDLEKKESRVAQPGLASTEEGRKERAHLAAAHRKDRDEEGKRESLEKASELHEVRTGEPLSEIEEGTKEHSKDEHKKQSKSDGSHSDSSKKDSETNKGEHKSSDDRVAQPGLAATEEGRRERAYIAAAHRDDRDEESKQASLEKASELHEERTGEPLAEAEELSKEASHKRKSKDSETEEKESGSSKQASPKKAKSSDKEGSGAKTSKSGEKSKSGDKKDDDHLERQERAHIAAAHRKGRDAEGRMESLAKASKIHEERTGEPLPEAVEKGAVEKPEDKSETHKRHHDDKEDRSTDDSGDNRKASPKRQKTEEEEKPIIAGHVVEQPGLAASADGRKERAFIASAHNKTHTEESQLESLEKANELHEKRTGEALPEAVERGVAAQ